MTGRRSLFHAGSFTPVSSRPPALLPAPCACSACACMLPSRLLPGCAMRWRTAFECDYSSKSSISSYWPRPIPPMASLGAAWLGWLAGMAVGHPWHVSSGLQGTRDARDGSHAVSKLPRTTARLPLVFRCAPALAAATVPIRLATHSGRHTRRALQAGAMQGAPLASARRSQCISDRLSLDVCGTPQGRCYLAIQFVPKVNQSLAIQLYCAHALPERRVCPSFRDLSPPNKLDQHAARVATAAVTSTD